MRKYWICWFFGLLCSCQEEVSLPLRDSDALPVIEGVWTDNRMMNQVRVTLSKDYYDSTAYRPIDDADVYIVREEGNHRIDFFFSEQTRTYLPKFNEAGIQGTQYTLHVKWRKNHYQSSGVLLEAPELDSVTYVYKEKRLLRPAGYYLTVHGKIPFEEDNYYRIRVVRNDTLMVGRDDYLLFDDTFGTSTLADGFDIETIPFQQGDEVRLGLFRLNESAYDYLSGLVELMYSDGGLFSPPPQNPPSNIEQIAGDDPAMGYFMVAPIVMESLTIE